MISKAKRVHGYRGSQLNNKSVRYRFGTAEFTVLVQHTQQHVFRGEKGTFINPYSCTDAIQQQSISGHISQNSVQSVQSVRYGCFCTEIEESCVGFLPINFKHGNRREEISKCCWFYFC
jgi:hypothetical protein